MQNVKRNRFASCVHVSSVLPFIERSASECERSQESQEKAKCDRNRKNLAETEERLLRPIRHRLVSSTSRVVDETWHAKMGNTHTHETHQEVATHAGSWKEKGTRKIRQTQLATDRRAMRHLQVGGFGSKTGARTRTGSRMRDWLREKGGHHLQTKASADPSAQEKRFGIERLLGRWPRCPQLHRESLPLWDFPETRGACVTVVLLRTLLKLAGGESDPCMVEEECYENQRYWIGAGWSNKLFPTGLYCFANHSGVSCCCLTRLPLCNIYQTVKTGAIRMAQHSVRRKASHCQTIRGNGKVTGRCYFFLPFLLLRPLD